MIGPEVETRMVITELIPHLVASLLAVIAPLLAVVDSVGAMVGERTVSETWTVT